MWSRFSAITLCRTQQWKFKYSPQHKLRLLKIQFTGLQAIIGASATQLYHDFSTFFYLKKQIQTLFFEQRIMTNWQNKNEATNLLATSPMDPIWCERSWYLKYQTKLCFDYDLKPTFANATYPKTIQSSKTQSSKSLGEPKIN